MNNPQDLKYTKDHEWVRIEGDRAVIGITDHAQQMLGDVVFVELPVLDVEFNAHDVLGNIESVKAVSEMFSPLSGTIVEVNDNLESAPEQLNSDAFGAGWIAVLAIKDVTEVDGLLSAEEYEQLIAEEE